MAQDLLIPAHAGVENHFPQRLARPGKGTGRNDGAVFQSNDRFHDLPRMNGLRQVFQAQYRKNAARGHAACLAFSWLFGAARALTAGFQQAAESRPQSEYPFAVQPRMSAGMPAE